MAKKLSKNKAEKILHDKQVKGRPLTEKQRKFFGAVASGAIPKAQIGDILRPITPESVGKFLDLFSVPQKALTKLVTGKYQTPSEAMNIQNPVGAFVTDMVLDPVALFGGAAGASSKTSKAMGQAAKKTAAKLAKYATEETALKNAHKYNPLAFRGKESAFYRKIGNEAGLQDLQSSGVVRSKPIPEELLEEYKRRNISTYPNPYFSVNKPAEVYGGKYMLEYTGDVPFKRFKVLDEVATPEGMVRIDDPGLKLYEKDWLRGYKEIPKSKKNQQGGSVESRMGGLTDKGFNYNGAWGGQFQEGGYVPTAQDGRNRIVPRVDLRATSDNTGVQKNIKDYVPKETVKPSKSKPKDSRHWQSDSRAKERINNNEYEESIVFQTAIDQLPYVPYLLAAKSFNEGRPFTAMSELLKAPKAVGYPYDAMVNVAQENPKGIDIKSLEDRFIPFVRLAADATFGNSIIEDIGKQFVASETPESRKNLFSTSRQYSLPSLFEASKSLGVDNNTLTKFIQDNWKSSGKNYKNVLDLAKKEFSKKQQGGMLPGVQGHMYARTGAPSEGKYAKKTLPSAAEGYEVLPDPTDPERKYKLSAVVQSAKDILNPVLRSKNPKLYDEWHKGRVEALKAGNVEKYDVEKPLPFYLTPEEVKGELSKYNKRYYDEYISSLRELNAFKGLGRESYMGTKEGEKPLEDLLYGHRLSTALVNLGAEDSSGKGFRYSYNPSTEEYKKEILKNGGTMSYYQHGLDFKPKTISKKGSKIKKDNDGYWNPENWGKPVQIDSNEITMQGVYEPLLGVSDTGDTQMMFPGQDYTFEGNSVTEYPIAQNGEEIESEGWGYKGDPRFMKKTTPSGETRYGWNPGRGYDLYRTVTPFKTKGDIRRYTPFPQSPEEVDFLANISVDQPVTKVDYEGQKHWNVPRFLVEPHVSEKRGEAEALMSEGPQTRADYRRNILADVFKYQMLQNEGDRGKAWKASKAFMRGNVNPLLRGEVYQTLAGEGRKPFSAGLLTSAIEDDFFKNEEMLKADARLNSSLMGAYEKEYLKQPLSDKEVDRYAFDWLTKYKKMPKKEARQYIKTEREKAKKEAEQYEQEYRQTFQSGGGINQLDAQPLKKLDQLLNFTNFNDMANAKKGKKIPKGQSGVPNINFDFLKKGINTVTANNIGAGIQAGSKIGQAVQRVMQAVEQKKMAKQTRALATPVAKAAATRDVDAPNMLARQMQANRPEYNLVTANDVGVNPFGTGYDVLSMAQNGTMIGGNPTEIQNTYAPNTLYDDLGYEPLDESSRVKQFERGGGIPKAPLGTTLNLIGQGANVAGDIIAGIIGLGTKKMNQQSNELLGQAAFQSGMQGVLGGQYGAYMKNGGNIDDEYKWVSHSWQPQVIAKFGEHNVKDLLKPDPMMNTLRAGGHLKEYTPPSERAMSTERPQFAMGGELNTHWGGDMELASYNPYMPGSGETHVARGLYHSESDGRGNTGIGMSYGGNMVEVENGEPIIEMQEGGSVQDKSAVVFGNLKIPSYVASELGDKDAKGMMFKSYVNDLSKKEAKQNKIVDKALKITDLVDGNSSFDLLSMNTAKAMLTGADMKLKEIAQKKMMAAGAQQAMHETADEMGFDVEQFINRGKIVQKEKEDIAQAGDEIPMMAAKNLPPDYRTRFDSLLPEPQKAVVPYAIGKEPFGGYDVLKPVKVPSSMKDMVERTVKAAKSSVPKEKKADDKMKPLDIAQMAYNELLPFIRPVNTMELQPEQLAGEMMALATNVLEPVQAQFYQPMLEARAPKMTAQEALNRNQADFNALARQIGNNPAAMSVLAAQKQAADRQAIAQAEAFNIQQEMATRNRNIAMLNDASLKNLAIADTQFGRQAQAKSATKAQAQAALSSIASKIGQNKLENLQSAVMQNMYNYRFGPKGRIMNYNPLAQFNIPQIANLTDEERKALKEQSEGRTTAKNGSIVKAIKNL